MIRPETSRDRFIARIEACWHRSQKNLSAIVGESVHAYTSDLADRWLQSGNGDKGIFTAEVLHFKELVKPVDDALHHTLQVEGYTDLYKTGEKLKKRYDEAINFINELELHAECGIRVFKDARDNGYLLYQTGSTLV